MVDFSKPTPVTDLDIAFPGSVKHLMPEYSEIPEEFKRAPNNKWGNLFSDWFYSGIKNLKLVPKPGIDSNLAMRHIKSIIGSFEPKHEHKESACAYLMSLWFEDATWEKNKKEVTI